MSDEKKVRALTLQFTKNQLKDLIAGLICVVEGHLKGVTISPVGSTDPNDFVLIELADESPRPPAKKPEPVQPVMSPRRGIS